MIIFDKEKLFTENVINKFHVEGLDDSSHIVNNESSIFFAKHQDELLVNKIRNDIKSYFNKNTNYYFNLLIDDYREIKKYALLFY